MPESSCHPRNTNPASAPVPALEAMMDDIERLIFHVVSPFVDESNPMLHLDELCAECRYKLAQIISAGRMQQCPTRGKFFGFLKVSFVNHVRSQVHKHVFTQKRAGVSTARNLSEGSALVGDAGRTKQLHLSLDDEDLGLQICGDDDDRRSWADLIEHLEKGLSPLERDVVKHLKTVELPFPQARRFLLAEAHGSIPTRPGWKLKHYTEEIGMTVEEFFRVMWRIRSKCRAVGASE